MVNTWANLNVMTGTSIMEMAAMLAVESKRAIYVQEVQLLLKIFAAKFAVMEKDLQRQDVTMVT
jgi:hypothetical protein